MSKVLIVEDDPMVALINKKYLESIDGIQFTKEVSTEAEVLQCLEEEAIDLILLDVYLPGKSGIEILETVRNKGYLVDVIMITAANSGAEVKKAYAYGAVDYLVKPFEFQRFKEAIEKHLKRKKCLEEAESIKQIDIDLGYQSKEVSIQMPKGLNKRTLDKIINFLQQSDNQVWTLRTLSDQMHISNVTIKKYMDYLEEIDGVYVELSNGHIGRPEHLYRLKNMIETLDN